MSTQEMKTPASPGAPDKRSGKVPLFLGSLALNSLRESGFTLPAALGEPIDNSLEAQANQISVVLEDGRTPSGKKGIARIVIADDGLGMDEEVLSRYLQIGFSTRYMSDKTIGKFGVGAKLGALSVARRIDVWSRTRTTESWRHVYLDLEELSEAAHIRENEEVYIEWPDEIPFPKGVAPVDPGATGTVVVWSKVDRLEEGRRATDTSRVRVEIEQELARTFRYFLEGGIKMDVNGKALLAYDPLFLMEGTWSDYVLTKEYKIPSAGKGGDDPGADVDLRRLDHFAAEVIADENITIGKSVARLRVTLYPREVTRRRFLGGDPLAMLLRIPGSEGVISFVRMNREINYTTIPRIFPAGIREFDRFFGIEVSFSPDLDSYFGVRNIKRGVEPEEHLRDEIRTRLSRYVNTARKKLKAAWSEAETKERRGEHDSILKAVADVDQTMPKGRVTNPAVDTEAGLQQLAQDVGLETPEEKARYVEQRRDLPLVLESVDFPGHSLMEVLHTSDKTLIRLNSRHRFYKELWGPLKRLAEAPEGSVSPEEASEIARRGVEVLTLMVLAYGKAESMQNNPHELFDELREYWAMFLHQFIGKVKDIV
jgi:hypothetical protein